MVIIAAAMQQEIQPFVDYYSSINVLESSEVGIPFFMKTPDNSLGFVVLGVGQTLSCINLMTLISEVNLPDIAEVILVGSCGALSEDLKLGDVTIVKSTRNVDVDYRPLDADLKLGEYMYDISGPKAGEGILIHEADGTIVNCLTSNAFGTTETKLRWFDEVSEEHPDEVAPYIIDMETSVVHRVCFEYNIAFSSFRVVTDTLFGKAQEEFLIELVPAMWKLSYVLRETPRFKEIFKKLE